MRYEIKVIVALLLLPILSIAAVHQQYCKPYAFLKNGLNVKHFNQCKALFKQCPSTGPFWDYKCINKILKNNAICRQYKGLSDVLDNIYLTAKQYSNLVVISQLFIADGQSFYYIISPLGCMVETAIGPRRLDKSLAEKYRKIYLNIRDIGEPDYKRCKRKGQQVFTISYEISDTCLACDLIATAKEQYIFSKTGKLLRVSLKSFTPDKNWHLKNKAKLV